MKQTILMTIAAFSILTQPTYAQRVTDSVNPQTLGSINVKLRDDATGACWTNLRESREYAEEKLRLKGYNVVPENGDFRFWVSVSALRSDFGICVYNIDIEIIKPAVVDGVLGVFKVGEIGTLGGDKNNANNSVIEEIQALIDAM